VTRRVPTLPAAWTTARQPSPRWRRDPAWAAFFIAPSLIGFAAFVLFPVLFSLGLSTVEWNLLTPPVPVGLQNYVLILHDPFFWRVMGNTVYYTAGTVLPGVALSLVLALALNRRLPGQVALRTVYFMPVISSTVAVAMVWRWIYNTDFGLLNTALRWLGLAPIGWLTTTTWAMPAVILMSIWKNLGYSMVIFLAGLQAIPRPYYDAAAVDGASGWQQFWRITLPLLSPATFFVTVMSVITSFQVFGQVYMMTGGGPAYATSTIVFHIYQQAFEAFRMGYSSAMAWALFVVIFVFTLLQMRYQHTWVHYE